MLPSWQTLDVPYEANTLTGLTYAPTANVTETLDKDTGDITLSVTGPARASTFVTASDVMLNTETLTIGALVYTFQTTLTDVARNVLIGADEADTLVNFKAAINRDITGVGTLYAASTAIHT